MRGNFRGDVPPAQQGVCFNKAKGTWKAQLYYKKQKIDCGFSFHKEQAIAYYQRVEELVRELGDPSVADLRRAILADRQRLKVG